MKNNQRSQRPLNEASTGKHFLRNAYKQILEKAAVLIFLLCLSANAFSQIHISLNVNGTDYPPGTVVPGNPAFFPIELPAATEGVTPYNFPLKAYYDQNENMPVVTAEWSITLGTCSGITLSPAGEFDIDGTCPPAVYDITVQVTDEDNNTAFQDFRVQVYPEGRDGFEFVHVLDRSGSMTLKACPGNSPECQNTRWNYLKTAVGLFNASLEGVSVPDDRIGAVVFNNTTTKWNTNRVPVDGNTQSAMNTWLSDINPTNLTAMGKGIQDGLSLFGAASSNKNMILFTDGMQNVTPLVTGTGSNLTVDGTRLGSTGVRIYCIGINATNAAYTILQEIANATDGEAYFNNPQPGDNQADLTASFYNEMIANILEGSSPQNIDYRYGTFPGSSVPVFTHRQIATGTIEESFVLNNNVPFAMFKAISAAIPGGIRNITIQKNGVDVTRQAKITTTPHFTIASFNFPFADNTGNMVTSGGEWILRITGLTGTNYETSATVDDHFLDITPKIDVHHHEVGEPLNISLNLKYNGIAITDSATVQAIVLKPGEDLGSLLANAKSDNTKDSEGNYDVSTGKFESLLSNPDFFNALIPTERILNLTHSGDGIYSAVFNDTEEAGPYRVIYKLKGEKKIAGAIERIITRCAMLTFGKAEFTSASEIHILENVDGDFPLQLYIKPQNKFGHLMGPGYGSMLVIKVGNEQLTDFVDRGDGSYLYNIPGGTIGQRPNVSINFRDTDIFEGKVSTDGPIDEPKYTFWFYVIIIIILIILILKRLSSNGSIKKLPYWLLILLLLIIIVLLFLSRQGIITI